MRTVRWGRGDGSLARTGSGIAFSFYNNRLYLAGGLTSGNTVLNVSLSAFVKC